MNYVLSSRQSFVVNQRSLSTRLDERDDGLFCDSHPGSKKIDKGALRQFTSNISKSNNPFNFLFSLHTSHDLLVFKNWPNHEWEETSSKRNVTNDRGQPIIAQ